MADVLLPSLSFGTPPNPDRLTNRGIYLASTLAHPDAAAHRCHIPESIQRVWDHIVAEGLPAKELVVYTPEVVAVLPATLHGRDGLVDPRTGLIMLIDQPDDRPNMIRVLLHEVAHLSEQTTVPYTVDEWYDSELRVNRAVLALARRLGVEDPALPAILAHERRALKTHHRWLRAAGQAIGSFRLPLAEGVLQGARTMSTLLGDSQRTGLARLMLRPGYRGWLLDLPRSMLRSFWAVGDSDPLAPQRAPADDAAQEDTWQPDAAADELADEEICDDGASPPATAPRAPADVPTDALEELLALEAEEAQLWAIPPDHPIFGRGDDRDDDDISGQHPVYPQFRFGETWNVIISDRRRASLVAFLSRGIAALPEPPTWTILTPDGDALAAAYVLVRSEDDLVRACAYLQSALLDQHIDATATATWSLYTYGIDPACEFSWYRLRMTFSGDLVPGWPPAAEVWVAMRDEYPGFLVAALQSFMTGWADTTQLCPVVMRVRLATPPSTFLAGDTRLKDAMRAMVSQWLDQCHQQAVAAIAARGA